MSFRRIDTNCNTSCKFCVGSIFTSWWMALARNQLLKLVGSACIDNRFVGHHMGCFIYFVYDSMVSTMVLSVICHWTVIWHSTKRRYVAHPLQWLLIYFLHRIHLSKFFVHLVSNEILICNCRSHYQHWKVTLIMCAVVRQVLLVTTFCMWLSLHSIFLNYLKLLSFLLPSHCSLVWWWWQNIDSSTVHVKGLQICVPYHYLYRVSFELTVMLLWNAAEPLGHMIIRYVSGTFGCPNVF